jgi:hypothetical protein
LSIGGRLKRLAGIAPEWKRPLSHFELEGLNMRLFNGKTALTAANIPDADVVIASFWLAAEWMNTLPASKGAKVYFVQHHEADFAHADRRRAAATYIADNNIIAVSGW